MTNDQNHFIFVDLLSPRTAPDPRLDGIGERAAPGIWARKIPPRNPVVPDLTVAAWPARTEERKAKAARLGFSERSERGRHQVCRASGCTLRNRCPRAKRQPSVRRL